MIVSFLDMFTQLPIIAPMALSLGATPFLVGLAVGMYSLTNMFGNMIGGRAIDRVGAKQVLTLGMVLTSVNLILYTLIGTGTHLVIVRLIHGLSSGLLAPSAFALIAQTSEAGRHGRTMAQSGAIVGLAAILGPAFSGIVGAKYGLQWVYFSVSALMAACALLVWLLVPKQLRKYPREDKTIPQGEMLSLLRCRPLVNAYIGSFSLMFNLGIVTYLLPLKVNQLSLNPALTGMMMSTFGVVAILIFMLPTNKMFDHFDSQKILFSGMFTVALSMTLLSLFPSQRLMFIAMGIFGLGFALMFPAMNTIILIWVAERNHGKAFGLFYALFSLGVVIGSFTMGILKASSETGFLLGGAIIFVMGIIVRFRTDQVQEKLELFEERGP